MKHIKTFLIAFIMLLTLNANAQLSVTAQVNNEPEKIETLTMSQAWLYKQEMPNQTYYYIVNTSQNSFDEDHLLYLGEDKETCLMTLRDILNIIENKLSYVEIEDRLGGKTILSYYSIFGIKGITIHNAHNAAPSTAVKKSSIEKCINIFEEMK